MDLLTADQEEVDRRSRKLRFDIGLLARRLLGAVDCLAALLGSGELRVGLFVASTDAAPAQLATGHRLEVVPGAGPPVRGARRARRGRPPAAAWFVTKKIFSFG